MLVVRSGRKMALSSRLQNLKEAYEEKLKMSDKGQLTSRTLKKVFLWLYNGSYDEAQKEWEALTHNKHPDVTWLKRKLAKKLMAVSNLININGENVPIDKSSQDTIEHDDEFLSVSKESCNLTSSPKDGLSHDLSGINLISTLPGCMVDHEGKENEVRKEYDLRVRNSKKGKQTHRRRALITRVQQASRFHNSFSSSSKDSDIGTTNLNGGDSPDVLDPSQKTIDGENDQALLSLSKERNEKVCSPTKPLKDEFKHDSSGTDQKGKDDGVKEYDLRFKKSRKGKPMHRRRALVTRVQQAGRSQKSSLLSSEDSNVISVDSGDSPDVVDPSQKTIDGENDQGLLSLSKERNKKVCSPTKSSKDKFKHDLSGTDQKGKEEKVRKENNLQFRNAKKGKTGHRKRALLTRAQQVHGFHNSISSSEDLHTISVDSGDSPDVVDPSQKTIDGENDQALLSLSKEGNKKVCSPAKSLKDEFKHDSSGIDQRGKEDGVKKEYVLRLRNSKKGKPMHRRRALVMRVQQVSRSHNGSSSSSEDSDTINVDAGGSRDVVDPSQKTIDGENGYAFLSMSKKICKKACSPTKSSQDKLEHNSSGTDQRQKEDGVSRKYDPQRKSSKKGKEPIPRDSVTRAQRSRELRNRFISSSEGSDIPVDAINVDNGDSQNAVDSSQETMDGEIGHAFLSLPKERAKKNRSGTPRKLPTVRNTSMASTSRSPGKESRENELTEGGKRPEKPRYSGQSTSKQTSLGLRADIGETSETTYVENEAETHHLEERDVTSEEHENQASTSGLKQVIDQVRKAKALSQDLSTATQNLRRIVNDPYQASTSEDENFVLEESGETTGPPSSDNAASKSKKWKPELEIRKRKWNAHQTNAVEVQWGCNDIDEDLERLKEQRKQEAPKRRKKKYWSLQETQWLKEGIKRFGKGNWSTILIWYPFTGRSSVDLKDKCRNMERSNEL